MNEQELHEKRSAAAKRSAETRRLNKIAAEERKQQELKKTNSSRKRNFNWLWLLLLAAAIVALVVWNPFGIQISRPAALVATKASVVNSTQTPADVSTKVPVITTALWTPATCSSISTEMGIPLTVLTEGNGFTACVYTGPIVKINIPHFTVVDVDRGQVEVWINSDVDPTTVESGNMTFRQWNGKLGSACSQVLSLDEYLQTLNENLHAVPGNFDCSNQ